MSLTHQAPKKADGLAVTLLAYPLFAIEVVTDRVIAAFSRKPKQHATDEADPQVPNITPNQKYLIADRVCIAEVRGQNVSFRQYYALEVIRITCREKRHMKPIEFTPAIADGAALIYDIDGAIQWVRQNGLESDAAKRASSSSQSRPGKGAAKTQAPARPVEEEAAKTMPAPPAAVPASAPLNIVPATGNKGTPFVGKIVSFGATQIKSEGRKPYTTYAMTLRSETGAYEKQFIGEHLGDLVGELSLREGQLVRLQLQGKHHFEVEVNGKMEARSRNHFAIETL